MQPQHLIFDRRLKHLQQARAAKNLSKHDFLLVEVATRMAERLEEVQASQSLAVDIGCRQGYLKKILAGKAGIQTFLQSESFPDKNADIVLDEEFLPFKDNSVDLFLSLLRLHWVNDLPGCLIQLRRALADRGLLVATLFGGQTLKELRQSIIEVESAGGKAIGPRISPFVEVKDAGVLLQRAGFHMPVADSEVITVTYKNIRELMHDLRGMGENNALLQRSRSFMGKDALNALQKKYLELFGNKEGLLPVTFEVITLTAWKS